MVPPVLAARGGDPLRCLDPLSTSPGAGVGEEKALGCFRKLLLRGFHCTSG